MFSFFGKKKKPAKTLLRSPAVTGTESYKRAAFRMPIEFPVSYTLVNRRGLRNATANDLSAGGLRLTCDEDFFKGSVLSVQFRVPDEFLATMTIDKEVYEDTPFGKRTRSIKIQPPSFEEFKVDAKILAVFFDLKRRKFAYGMAFDNIAAVDTEELQRFVHLWQLNQIRQRNAER